MGCDEEHRGAQIASYGRCDTANVSIPREHPPVRNINKQLGSSFSSLEQVALFLTKRIGSFWFFLLIVVWTVLWLGWNIVGPAQLRLDPAPGFVLWLFISNMIQIMLMPLIMIGQNLLSRHAELRAEADFKINIRAEHEVAVILSHLEQQAIQLERQGELILKVLHHLEVMPTPAGTTSVR
jgi:uncharacterized membrane protein